MSGCTQVRLGGLMRRTEGTPGVRIGLVDGPVAAAHPELAAARIEPVAGGPAGSWCLCPTTEPCLHGTFVAGILAAARGGSAPAICPGCTVLVRPVFADCVSTAGTSPTVVARGIHDCIDAGAGILNLSSALTAPGLTGQPALVRALDRACRLGVLVVAAAGNEPAVTATALTGHPWVVAVSGYGPDGRPVRHATTGHSVGSRGLGAPSVGVTSLTPAGGAMSLDGTSFAAPFVTGAAALLWSLFPGATAAQVRRALLGTHRRTSVVPPLLDAERAYDDMTRTVRHARPAA